MDISSPNFIYALILTRSRLELLPVCVIFGTFVTALIMAHDQYQNFSPLNILKK